MTFMCSKCGRSTSHVEVIQICFDNYGSKFDGEKWCLSVCDDCLENLAEGCKIKPTGYGVTGYEEYEKAMVDAMQKGLI